jgi:mono/diheme cytochrome c family protein
MPRFAVTPLLVATLGFSAIGACYAAPPDERLAPSPVPTPAPSASVDNGGASPRCTSGVIVAEAYEEEDGEREREGDDGMAPGRACIACHAREDGPDGAVAGTVYPSLREPNDCAGAPPAGLSIEITDAAGTTTRIPVTKNGNFFVKRKKFLPMGAYTVAVVGAMGRREMATKLTGAADCNGCHTATGSGGAPGRIQVPN